MPAHHQPHHSCGEHAAISSRHRPCRKARLILQPASHVALAPAHEEAALCALADLLSAVTDQREEAA